MLENEFYPKYVAPATGLRKLTDNELVVISSLTAGELLDEISAMGDVTLVSHGGLWSCWAQWPAGEGVVRVETPLAADIRTSEEALRIVMRLAKEHFEQLARRSPSF